MNDKEGTYCWCGTRFSDPAVWGWRWCSAHGYQDHAYGPTPDLPTIPHA